MSAHVITGAAKVAGVIGWPIAQSLSPVIHGHWLRKYDINGAYIPLPIAPEDFETAIPALAKLGFRGFNLTIPYKERILPLLDEMDASAARLGAVNTVTIGEIGALKGYNTDGAGFVRNLAEAHKEWAAATKTALLLGAGGAARGIAFALADAGVSRILISNRTIERAEALADDLAKHDIAAEALAFPLAEEDLERSELLINTTSLGMSGQTALEIDLTPLPAGAIVADIVYSPLETELLAQAKAKGFQALEGLGMLLHQARAGFEMWFGQAVDVTPELRTLTLDMLAKKKA